MDAYVRRSTLPSYAQLYDFHTKALPVDAVAAWAGTVHYSGQVRPGDLRTEALEGCINLRDTAAFQDVHCHTFTPASFVEVFLEMAELGILPFRILQLVPTFLNTVEFYVRLQPVDPDAPDDPQTLADFAPVLAKADSIPPAYAVAAKPTTPPHFRLSDRERRFIEAKRRALIGVRRFLGQIPH